MKRRSFVKSTLASGVLGSIALAKTQAAPGKKAVREWYELRVYTFNNAAQAAITENYFEMAAIPALGRIGYKNIGVFKEAKPGAQPRLFVLIPFASPDNLMVLDEKMAADTLYTQAAASYLNAPATAPAYERIESSLLKAFAAMPVMEIPQKKERIFELRRYESSGENAGRKKIDMFNNAGEIAIFRRVGLTPVFFGETVIGTMRPNLTYMLQYDDMATHDRNWKLFGNDPEWKRIKSVPGYEDTNIVSRITSTMLVPAACSQV
jgi:NIPSNAP